MGEDLCEETRILMISHCVEDVSKEVLKLFSLKG